MGGAWLNGPLCGGQHTDRLQSRRFHVVLSEKFVRRVTQSQMHVCNAMEGLPAPPPLCPPRHSTLADHAHPGLQAYRHGRQG